MIILSKFQNKTLCKGLTSHEFRCKCKNEHCRATIISPQLLKAYESFRTFLDVPLKINSGYRCSHHNFKVGGKPLSRHALGEAVDISLANILEVWNIDRVKYIATESGFKYIQVYPTFVHLDVREA